MVCLLKPMEIKYRNILPNHKNNVGLLNYLTWIGVQLLAEHSCSSNVWLLTFKILWQKVLKASSKKLIREEEKMKVSRTRRESFWIIALSPNASFLVSLLSTNDVNWAFLRSTGTAGIFRRVQEGKSYSPDDDSQGKGKANDESLLEVRLYLVTDVLHQTKINLIFANFSASTHFWFRRLDCTIV